MSSRQHSLAARRAGRRALHVICAVALAFACVWRLASNVASAAPGDLDTTFGNGGTVTIQFGATGFPGDFSAIALYPGNKLVAAGTRNTPPPFERGFLVGRFSADGQLDTSFRSGSGVVHIEFSPGAAHTATDVAVQDDGKVVVGGYIGQDGDEIWALARINQDGTLDTTFDGDGKVFPDFNNQAQLLGLVIQPDQKILAAGFARGGNSGDFALARFLTNGQLDPSFGTGGIVTTDFGGPVEPTFDAANDVILQPDGRIVAAGSVSGGLHTTGDFAFARYTASGALDPTFDDDGRRTLHVANNDRANSVAIQADGKIVAGGTQRSGFGPNNFEFTVIRMRADGATDNTFDGDGVVVTNINNGIDEVHKVILFPDGKILAVGGSNPETDFGGGAPGWALARYTDTGALDATFGAGGIASTRMGAAMLQPATAFDAVLQSNGKVVAAGTAWVDGGTSPDVRQPALARYLVADPPASTVQFDAIGYDVGAEECTSKNITVTRTGDTTTTVSVDFVTLDQHDLLQDQKGDFTFAAGTLTFAPGETSKTFQVLWNEDSIRNELSGFARIALTNPVGAALGDPATANLQITDDDAGDPKPNAIDDAATFVCQHYHDFLNRQADAAGQEFWTNQITSCGDDQACREVRRINVSAAFFLSPEYQSTGFFAVRVHRVAFGRRSDTATSRLSYLETIRDTRRLGEGVIGGQRGSDERIEENRQAYVTAIVTSPAFVLRFPEVLTAAQYVDALYESAGVTPADIERIDAINAFGAGGVAGRAAALRKVAESRSVIAAEFRAAFVLLQYHGYLRRSPIDFPNTDDSGYQFWLGKLNEHNGDFQRAEMVKSFLVSGEYRARFGTP